MPRPASRRRRVGTALLVSVVAALVVGGLAFRAPSSAAGGPGVGSTGAVGVGAFPSASSAAPVPSVGLLSDPTQSQPPVVGMPVGFAGPRMPAHIALDAWPRPEPPPVWSLTGYVWPLAHPRLTLPFGPTAWGTRVVNGDLFHDGVDLATFCGDRVLAAHDGVVLAAGRHFDDDLGWVGSLAAYYRLLNTKQMWPDLPIVVVTDDGNGYRSVYAHFSKLTVHVGQQVHAGQLIGYEGMTGHATGCHVHYGLFSPLQTWTFAIEPKVARDMRLPRLEIARIDPLLVLPYRRGLGGVVRQPVGPAAIPSP
jgi:murein DD-endopeptidase MepM/ murein hydrolase activator NlpD